MVVRMKVSVKRNNNDDEGNNVVVTMLSLKTRLTSFCLWFFA